MIKTKLLFLVFSFCLLDTSHAQQAKSFDYDWLEGRWEGEAFGGTTESIWSPPSEDGTMIGVFRLFTADGEVGVYQFIVLDETGMKIKHFNSNLVGWETKDKFVTFEMIDFDKDKIQMESLLYERKSDDEIITKLDVSRNGKVTTEVLTKRRVQ